MDLSQLPSPVGLSLALMNKSFPFFVFDVPRSVLKFNFFAGTLAQDTIRCLLSVARRTCEDFSIVQSVFAHVVVDI